MSISPKTGVEPPIHRPPRGHTHATHALSQNLQGVGVLGVFVQCPYLCFQHPPSVTVSPPSSVLHLAEQLGAPRLPARALQVHFVETPEDILKASTDATTARRFRGMRTKDRRLGSLGAKAKPLKLFWERWIGWRGCKKLGWGSTR